MTHRTGALTSRWSIHYSLGRRGRAGLRGDEDEGLRAEARRALSDGRGCGWLAAAGWVRAGCDARTLMYVLLVRSYVHGNRSSCLQSGQSVIGFIQ
eukprot:COSAG01_NODE_4171_length_5273_cov_169.689602_2_plen_96_part_00